MPFSSFPHIRKVGRSEAKTLASDSYPELEQILIDRPPPNSHQASGVDGLCALCNAEPATQEISGTTVGERCAEHLMGVPGAGTPAPDFGQAVYGSQHTAGIMDWLDRKLSPMAPPQGGRWSFDWCRYRKDSHCYYPSDLDPNATQMMGQAVWHFQDRGNCPRYTWESQEQCPIGAPGPNSGVPGASSFFSSRHGSLDEKDPDFKWHFIASWADVRAKAKRIRAEGGVRIIAAPDARNPYITAEVKGDHHTYQTTILRTIGGKSVAGWECTCAWAHYAWGRSGRWKKFEGRQCSHALATIYQAQADEMFGGRVKEIERRPVHFENPAEYQYKAPEQPVRGPNKSTWRTGVKLGSFSEERPIAMEVEARLEAGEHPNVVLGYLREAGAPWPEYILTEALQKPFKAKDPAHELHTIVNLDGDHAVTDAGERIPVEHLTHPEFDLISGLEPPEQLQTKSAYEPEGYTDWRQFDTNRDYRRGRQDGYRGDFHDHEHLQTKQDVGLSLEPHEVDYMTGHGAGIADAQQHAHDQATQPERMRKLWGEHGVDQDTHDWELKFRESSLRTGMLRWGAASPYGELLAPHWQPPEAPTPRSKGRANNPDATKFSTYEPDFQKKIASQFHENVPPELGIHTHEDLVENIKGMYREAKKTNPSAVKTGMSWYKDAHNFCKNLAGKHEDGNLRKSLGMTAALSPQNHWEENKTQAEYIHHHLSADPDSDDGKFNISPEHAQAAMDKQAQQASVVKGHRQVVKLTPGKRFADMDPEEAAHSLKAQAQYTHELKVPGRLKNDGEPWSATFANGTGAMAKAVRIHRGEDPDDVLQGHKVRSFFNNMADHTNRKKRDDLTMDTHAVSLAAGAKFGASAPEIKTMFANGANKEQNVTGTYGYLADAYRKAHKDLVDSGEMPKTSSPHHLQAVTWTHWRDINDEPGPLKEANRGRFRDYSGENAARLKKFRQQQAGQSVAASLHWAQDTNAATPDDSDDSGELLDPTAYDPDAIDPDFDPDLADDARQAEWEAEPEEMAQRQADAAESDQIARRGDQSPPHISMLHWGAVQDSAISEDVDPSTDDAMDQASAVQKDYNDQANQAQDDWYFNQPNQTKPFPDSPASIPTYMSAMPYLGMNRWGAEAAEEMLHDEPEGALPSTDGGAPSEDWDRQHSPTAQDPISAGPAGFGSPLDPGYQHEDMGYPEADEAVLRPSGGPGAGSSMNRLEDQFTSLDATGSLDPGAEGRAWLLKGGSPRSAGGDQGIGDSDIAAMARRYLDTGELPEPQSKIAAKVFSPAEQQELIQEGSDGTRASNLDRLMLEGTHYQSDEDDEALEGLLD